MQALLGLAVALAALRMVVVPWTQAQGETRQQLEVLTQRLDRSAGVAGSKDVIIAARDALAASTESSRKDFPLVDDRERFRLEAQRQIAAVAAGGNVKVTLFDWIMDGTVPEAGLSYGRVTLKLEGPLDRLVAVHGEIEGRLPFVAIREAKVSLGRGAAGLSSNPASIVLMVDLYYRERAAAPAVPDPQTPGAQATTAKGAA
jgi:hypothetical protein